MNWYSFKNVEVRVDFTLCARHVRVCDGSFSLRHLSVKVHRISVYVFVVAGKTLWLNHSNYYNLCMHGCVLLTLKFAPDRYGKEARELTFTSFAFFLMY